VRYYWYGVHPYRWYGSYPTAYQTQGDTYNYYTYNYNADSQPTSGYAGSLQGVDETTFEDVRQKLAAQQEQQPQPETLADNYFEDGVAAFEQEDYETAAKAFADAVALEPDDLILPFAYVQALFADEQYSRAAEVLRSALEDMPADEQGLYFPRGLYAEDETLFEQIEQLQRKADVFNYDYDLKLLLGYQLIGVEKYDQARQVLEDVNRVNQDSADILIELIDDIEQQVESDL
jgi:tetratricopeptide (TPR) repeat protein